MVAVGGHHPGAGISGLDFVGAAFRRLSQDQQPLDPVAVLRQRQADLLIVVQLTAAGFAAIAVGDRDQGPGSAEFLQPKAVSVGRPEFQARDGAGWVDELAAIAAGRRLLWCG